jgi:hypothetical protein
MQVVLRSDEREVEVTDGLLDDAPSGSGSILFLGGPASGSRAASGRLASELTVALSS